MNKFLALFSAVCILLALSACGGKIDNPTYSDESEPPSVEIEPGGGSVKDSLSVAMTQDRGTLDPPYMYGYDLHDAIRMVYEPLFEIDGDGNMVWVLATGLEMVEPTVWRVTLREGVTFADGSPFTADDVLFSLKRANNRTGEPATFPLLNLEKTKALDERTVEIIFDSYDMSYVYSFPTTLMFDTETCGGDVLAESLGTTPNGTGPYVVTDYLINGHLDLTARESGYWGKKPAIKNLRFEIMTEDSQRVTALETGMVDIAAIPYADVKYVQTLKNYTVNIGAASSGTSIALYFNPAERSPFYDNPDARKAVALAIDKQAIASIAYSGFASISRLPVSVYSSGIEDRFMDLGVYGIGYDPELAKEYAEKSGLIGKEILLIDNGSPDRQVVAELIQANLREIGIEVKIQNLDAGSWFAVVFDDTMFDMAIDITGIPSNTVAQNYYAWINFHIGGSFTRNPWPGKDRTMELANRVMSVSDLKELGDTCMELTQLQIDAMLWYNLVDLESAVAYNSGLSGYETMYAGNVNYASLSWVA
jgi:peptide/nickel transport system substrate-binding protein